MKTRETTTRVRAFDRAYINGQFVTPHGMRRRTWRHSALRPCERQCVIIHSRRIPCPATRRRCEQRHTRIRAESAGWVLLRGNLVPPAAERLEQTNLPQYEVGVSGCDLCIECHQRLLGGEHIQIAR
jgi:hypothetical protein